MQFSFLGLSPWDRFLKAKQNLVEELKKDIRQRKSDKPGEDILSILLQATYEDGQAMDEDEMVDELIPFIDHGHETT